MRTKLSVHHADVRVTEIGSISTVEYGVRARSRDFLVLPEQAVRIFARHLYQPHGVAHLSQAAGDRLLHLLAEIKALLHEQLLEGILVLGSRDVHRGEGADAAADKRHRAAEITDSGGRRSGKAEDDDRADVLVLRGVERHMGN